MKTYLHGALAVVMGAAGGELAEPGLLEIELQKVEGRGGEDIGPIDLGHACLHCANFRARVGCGTWQRGGKGRKSGRRKGEAKGYGNTSRKWKGVRGGTRVKPKWKDFLGPSALLGISRAFGGRTVVGPVGAVIGLGRVLLEQLGRDHKGRDPHELQLLARHVVRLEQKLQFRK